MHQEFNQLLQLRLVGLLSAASSVMVDANDTVEPPPYSFQVHFPRIEFVLDGSYTNTLCAAEGEPLESSLEAGSCLFVPAATPTISAGCSNAMSG
ncbi:MAG: hypothetical protein P4M00_08725 [Azospirillaceae bacterium]|nr:hypothetical protein [Azospirillaceae bacterium]